MHRIFIVEDHPAIRAAFTSLVDRETDMEVCGSAATAAIALAEIPSLNPDMVLVDLSLPDMDGFAATRAIRLQEAQHNGHIPIIAMTANAMQGDRERCLAAGMNEFIAKPCEPAKLFQIMLKCLSREPV